LVIDPPPLTFGYRAKIANFLESIITLQDGRDELFPRSAAFIHATPFGSAVQIAIVRAVGSLKLDAKTTLRTDIIERARLTAPRLRFPYFGTAVATGAERITVPATMFPTNDRTATMPTSHVRRIEALATN
jgi:hypothetical protein